VEKLMNESKIDLSYSGSTVIGCYMLHDKLYCSNVGDSRAIVGKKDSKGNWMVQPISNDHKPNHSNESDRIIRCKGRIDKFKDADGKNMIYIGNPVGPLRVWLKDSTGPGLAMTRSFGDLVAASVGVCW
jgi:serine/threonine protein phosphatase PrpC